MFFFVSAPCSSSRQAASALPLCRESSANFLPPPPLFLLFFSLRCPGGSERNGGGGGQGGLVCFSACFCLLSSLFVFLFASLSSSPFVILSSSSSSFSARQVFFFFCPVPGSSLSLSDYATSGLLMLAHNQQTAREVQDLLQSRRIHKEYVALVYGHPKWEVLEVETGIAPHPSHPFKMVVSSAQVLTLHGRGFAPSQQSPHFSTSTRPMPCSPPILTSLQSMPQCTLCLLHTRL